jgi:hypothetical protein
MLIYEENRTEDIVKRLIIAARISRFITISYSVLFFVGFALPLGLVVGRGSVWLFGLLGGISGLVIGRYLAALSSVTVEWLAQMLVAIENSVTLLNKINKNVSRGS